MKQDFEGEGREGGIYHNLQTKQESKKGEARRRDLHHPSILLFLRLKMMFNVTLFTFSASIILISTALLNINVAVRGKTCALTKSTP
jgi:hypothetical protein